MKLLESLLKLIVDDGAGCFSVWSYVPITTFSILKSFLLIASPLVFIDVLMNPKKSGYPELKLVVEVALAPFGLLTFEDSFELGKNACASVLSAVTWGRDCWTGANYAYCYIGC